VAQGLDAPACFHYVPLHAGGSKDFDTAFILDKSAEYGGVVVVLDVARTLPK
jgi:hypothetical protein